MNTIDEGLYSRQLFALGHDTMKSIASCDVLIVGLKGLGVEIAKNLILTGVRSLTVVDNSVVQETDFGTNYYLNNEDVGQPTSTTIVPRLAELNPYVKIIIGKEDYDVTSYHVIVFIGNYQKAVKLNDVCHNKTKFIYTNTQGVFGTLFCDFGENFLIKDIDGEPQQSIVITNITNEENATVMLDKKNHGLSVGEYIQFSNIKGMENMNGQTFEVVKIVDNNSFKIKFDSRENGQFINGEYSLVKQTKVYNFKTMSETQAEPEFVPTNFVDFERPKKLHLLYTHNDTMKSFRQKYDESVVEDKLVNLFYHNQRAEQGLVPINSIIGGIVAQEVVKACSGKFHPITQWLYYDAFNCFPDELPEIPKTTIPRYRDQTMIFGTDFQDRLVNTRCFIVGSGAIGCEHLKNFAMIGVGCGKNGKIYITDMDTIEKSNLNRQFLFRPKDIGRNKSTVASEAVKSMNPDLCIESHQNKVCPETEQFYNDAFFDNIDLVANALDNIQARHYTDARCVNFKKPLLESGTLGTKGNVQVVLPPLTITYSETRDPVEQSIPICTLKSFPNSIEHTVQWARDLFEGEFTKKIQDVIQYANDPNSVLKAVSSEQYSLAKNIVDFGEKLPRSFDDCVKYAYDMWHYLFCYKITELLNQFPSDAKTPSGTPFWIGEKKCPTVLTFNNENKDHLDFIIAASNLIAYVVDFPQVNDVECIKTIVGKLTIPQFGFNSKQHISVTDAEEKEKQQNVNTDELEKLLNRLPDVKTFNSTVLKPIEFEKDDDTNYHIAFITAASNLRAMNYGITKADFHKTKGVAGKIIPALATTTTVVSGLVTVELYKLVQRFDKIERYSDAFINLALPFFGFSEPKEATKLQVGENFYTIWDCYNIKGPATVNDLMEYFVEKENLTVTMIGYGTSMLYSDLFTTEKQDERKNMTIEKILTDSLNITITTGTIDLIILAENDEGDQIDIPVLKYTIN